MNNTIFQDVMDFPTNISDDISKDVAKFSNTNTTIFVICICILILSFLIKNNAFKHNKPTCDNYVVNSYLYITLASLLTIGFIYILNYIYNDFLITYTSFFGSDKNIPSLYLIISFISFILLVFIMNTIHYINPSKFIVTHILWILIIILFSNVLYPIIKIKQYSSYINLSILSTAVIMFLMAIIVKLYPSYFNKINSLLFIVCFISLITIIVTDVINDVVIKHTSYNQYITYFGVVVFTLFIVFDTTNLYKRALYCKMPNYPSSSVDLLIDCYNLIVDFIDLYSN